MLISADNLESWRRKPETYENSGYQVSRATGCANGPLLVTTRGQNQLSFSPDQGQKWQTTPVTDIQMFTAGAGCSTYVLRHLSKMSGDAFVAAFDRTGAVKWSTYLSDVGLEAATALNIDRSGDVLVAGTANSGADILVARYSPDGKLLWKKAIGGSSSDIPFDISGDGAGSIVIAGWSRSDDFPVTTGGPRTAQFEGFAAKLSADGEIIWARFLERAATSLAIEPGGSILVTGTSQLGIGSALIRIDSAGTLVTPLKTIVHMPAVVRTDAAGSVFLAGPVLAEDSMNATPGAYVSPIRARRCAADAWMGPIMRPPQADLQIARLRAGSLETEFSALLGGECGSVPQSLDVSTDGRVTVGFITQAQAFDLRTPVATSGFCKVHDLSTGVAQLSSDGTRLLRSSLLDGCGQVRVTTADDTIYAASDNNLDATVVLLPPAMPAEVRLDNIVNALSGTGPGIAPGELITLRGSNLGPAEPIDFGLNPLHDLPVEAGGTQVLLNGQPVPLLRVSADRVVAAAPYRLETNVLTVQVVYRGTRSNQVFAPVIASDPALLARDFPSTDPESTPQANAQNSDGSPNGPSNPARAGDIVWVFATGLGETNTAAVSGAVARTEALTPTALFRDRFDVLWSPHANEPPLKPAGIRSMPGFITNLFAVPVVARETEGAPGRGLVSITSAGYLRGTNRRNFSPSVVIYVCTPDATGVCP